MGIIEGNVAMEARRKRRVAWKRNGKWIESPVSYCQ